MKYRVVHRSDRYVIQWRMWLGCWEDKRDFDLNLDAYPTLQEAIDRVNFLTQPRAKARVVYTSR